MGSWCRGLNMQSGTIRRPAMSVVRQFIKLGIAAYDPKVSDSKAFDLMHLVGFFMRLIEYLFCAAHKY